MHILLLGSGGREHAIADKLVQSSQCTQLFIAPGNAGTATIGTNVALKLNDFAAIGDFCTDKNIEMVVVGPEQPLVDGIADYFQMRSELSHIMVIGPSKAGAQLEGSKTFGKEFMLRNKIPTARYKSFYAETINEGIAFLKTLKAPYVLKADGLAAGKGVLILDDLDEAIAALREMLIDAKFGDASRHVVIEEFLSGIELSVFVLTDGKHFLLLPSAKDYKRVGEGDTGLNTGGMGSVSPVPFADKEFMHAVEHDIVAPTVRGLDRERIDYKGFIFVGLMAVTDPETGKRKPYVIEYNVRMGDPETESVFPRIKSDVVTLFSHCWHGSLDQAKLDVDHRYAACVMMTAAGYPGSYPKGDVIAGVDQVQEHKVFHAGTKLDDEGRLTTNGGRVMCVTAMAETLPEALLKSYQSCDLIAWDGKYMRRDVGQDLLRLMIDDTK